MLLYVLFACCCLQHATATDAEIFSEELIVERLGTRHFMVHFHFKQSTTAQQHPKLFPPAVMQIADTVPFTEVELHMTHGRWYSEQWGLPLVPVKPTGAELRSVFNKTVRTEEVSARWSDLTHALSGLFCASLHLMAIPAMTTMNLPSAPQQPHAEQQFPEDITQRSEHKRSKDASKDNDHGLLSWLPKESVCSENLTPWVKLLPCRDRAGLAQFLEDRGSLYGSRYHSMSVLIKSTPLKDSPGCRLLQLTQTLTLVIQFPKHRKHQLLAAPESFEGKRINISEVLGSEMNSSCLAASLSRLYIIDHDIRLAAKGPKAVKPCDSPSCDIGDNQASPINWSDNVVEKSDSQGVTTPEDIMNISARALQELNLDQEESIVPHPIPGWHRLVLSHLDEPVGDVMKDISEDSKKSPVTSLGLSFIDIDLLISTQIIGNTSIPSTVTRRIEEQDGSYKQSNMALLKCQPGSQRLVRSCPPWIVRRHLTGSGTHKGSMILELQSTSLRTTSKAVPLVDHVCIFQMVPWYVRVWLHTLELKFDDQLVPVSQYIEFRRVWLAQDRQSSLVLDICLTLPQGVQRATLEVGFTKAFLTVAEQPPDANRGFDIPAAVITYSKAAVIRGGTWQAMPVDPQTQVEQDAEPPALMTPLLHFLSVSRPQQLYVEGLLVQMATPDISMPYNVICLTSTVLAIFVGAFLNALLKGSEKKNHEEEEEEDKVKAKKANTVKLLLMVIGAVILVVVFDPETNRFVREQLHSIQKQFLE